jgi:hypothetical protein
VSSDNLADVEFKPTEYTHGDFDFEISYTWQDPDTNESNVVVSESRTDTFSINIASQVDQIEIALTPTSDVEETNDYALNLNLNQHDDDGSEIASVNISGIPSALIIVDANGNQIGNYSDNGDGTVTCVLRGDEVNAGDLALHDTTETYGGTFSVDVEAFSLDKVTKEISSDSENGISLTITPQASAILEVDAGSAQEDKIIADEDNSGMDLDLDVIMSDLDGSEKLQIEFGDTLPVGFTVVYINNGNEEPLTTTTYLTPDEAQTIKLIPPTDYNGTFDLDINVKTVDFNSDGTVADTLATAETKTVHLTVNAVNDGPISIDDTSSTNEDTKVAIDVLNNDSDIDTGDTLTIIKIDGQNASNGQTITITDDNGDIMGTAKVVNAEIEFTPSETLQNMDEGTTQVAFNYTISDGTAQSTSGVTVDVTSTPDAKDPTLSVSIDGETINDDNTEYTYDIDVSVQLTDTDGSESLSISIDGIPDGCTLSNTAEDTLTITNGTATLTPNQVEGLTITSSVELADDPNDSIHITVNATSTEDDGGDTAIQTAVLIDGVVEGAGYETSSGITGITDSNGSFSFREGDSVVFSVGGVVLGVATAEDIASGQTFLQDIADVELTNLNDEYLENMATFLQSIDSDDGDNIIITEQMRELLADASIDLRVASEEEVAQLVQSVGATYVEEDVAMEHVQEMTEEYTDLEAEDFEEHIDDSIITATLGTSGTAGITYVTSSGQTGITDESGEFTYQEKDTITFTDAQGNVIAVIEASDIGIDAMITFEELISLGKEGEAPVNEQEENLLSDTPEETVEEEITTTSEQAENLQKEETTQNNIAIDTSEEIVSAHDILDEDVEILNENIEEQRDEEQNIQVQEPMEAEIIEEAKNNIVQKDLSYEEEEVIDLTSFEQTEVVEIIEEIEIDLEEIIDMTAEEEDELVFVNDDGEMIDFNESEDWTPSSDTPTTVEGVDGNFNEYVSNTNSDVSVFVNEEIDIIQSDI